VKVHDCNWFMLKDYLTRDDRIVLPIGSTEQHGYLSVGADAIMAERVSIEAAESLGVPVLPALPFGVTPYFTAFPGSPSLRTDTLNAIIRDLLDSLHRQGFRRIAVINGHGGNSPARGVVREWLTERRRPRAQALFHDWWNAPRVWAVVQRYDSAAAHGSWMENFPWTRLSGVVMPKGAKQPLPATLVWQSPPEALRELTVDGVFGGSYERSDDEVLEVWRAGVAEVRDVIENGWANTA
jgi:creatinine amidohydrolase